MPVTADSTLWTADTVCVTADGRIICIPADVAEAAAALDATDAAAAAAAATILTAVSGSYTLTGSNTVLGLGYSLTGSDAAFVTGAQVLFGTVDEAVAALDNTDGAIAAGVVTILIVDAGNYTLTGSATGLGLGYWLSGADAVFVIKPVVETVVGGGAHYYPPRRPLPVIGYGYGILPELWGEAHGVVGVAGQSAAQVLVRAAAIGACGQAGNAAAVLKALSVAGNGAVGARGSGEGTIMKFSGSASGHHDDDEAAVIAFLLAA